jgi:transposase
MSKSTRNSGKQWTAADVKQLRQLARENTPTPGAVQSKASELGISLKPTNQSPYNRRGK